MPLLRRACLVMIYDLVSIPSSKKIHLESLALQILFHLLNA